MTRLSSLLAVGVALVALAQAAHADTLKASHQWPSGTGDFRDEMIQMIARDLEAADVDLDIKTYPGASLVKPRDQWNALAKG